MKFHTILQVVREIMLDRLKVNTKSCNYDILTTTFHLISTRKNTYFVSSFILA